MLVDPVILPIPRGEKGPVFKGWNKITYEDTQTQEYRRWIEAAVRRGGNLGILLGPPSGGLVAIDFDDDMEVEEFLRWSPWAEKTLRTRGRKGCQMWFYMDGGYPRKRIVLKELQGKPSVEFRGGGVQSVIWGVHPAGMRYTVIVEAPPMHIEYVDLATWMAGFRGKVDGDEWREGQSGDFSWLKRYKGSDIKWLDLLGMLEKVGIRFTKRGEEKYAIKCPWANNHTTGSGSLDAVVWQYRPRGMWFPAFNCLHAHCESRKLGDLLEWLETTHGVRVANYCRPAGSGTGRVQLVAETYTEKILDEKIELPKPLIDGLLYAGSKMMIAAPAKIGKTWMGIDMALSLATGNLWMGFDTCQTRILYLNMEMRRPFFKLRLREIIKARKIAKIEEGYFNVMHLRGTNEARALSRNLEPLIEHCQSVESYGLIIIDPIYKILGDRDENTAKDVADLLANIDVLIDNTDAAVAPIHHFAKGNPNAKAIGDRASGSGVFFRDPDAYITITKCGEPEEKTARLDFEMREVPGIKAFGIRWENFQWLRDSGIDISTKVKQGKNEQNAAIILDILKSNPSGMTYGDLKESAKVGTPSVPPGSFARALEILENKIKQNGRLYFAI